MALRQNLGRAIYHLKKAIWAVLFHFSETCDLETKHKMCPSTSDSWYKDQVDKINGTNSYEENIGLPTSVKKKIYPTFIDLSNDNLLQKCLHGKTQNNTESINEVIWERCPKDIFLGCITLETSVTSDVNCPNDGAYGILHIHKKLGLQPGKFTNNFCIEEDTDRVNLM